MRAAEGHRAARRGESSELRSERNAAEDRQTATSRQRSAPALEEPVEIAKFWKNRRRNESVRVTLAEYEGHCLINVRVYSTGADGIDRPTAKGVAMAVRKLPELAQALVKAEDKARELGLLEETER